MSSRSKKAAFQKGDRVSARWSGSNAYYDAKVLDVTSRTYKVQFDDGSISSLKLSEVKKLATSSKESSPKASKSKSRSRSRSAGRAARSRSRSPARREKKAPAPKNEKKASTRANKKKEDTQNSNSTPKDEVDSVSKPALTREKIGLLKSSTFGNVSPVVISNSFSKEVSVSTEKREESSSERVRSSRLAAMKSAEITQRILESKFSANARNVTDKSKYSDDDEEEEEEEEEEQPKQTVSKLMKTAYFMCTAFRMVLMPASLLFLVFACTRKQCTILDVPQFYTRWKDIGNAMKFPIAGIFTFHMVQTILSLIPLGRKDAGFSMTAATSKDKFEYRLNGLLVLLLNLITFALCAYFGAYMNWGYDKFRGIALSAAIYCTICAIAFHIYATVKGGGTAQSRAPFVGNFYNGVFVNPILFGKVDVKTSFIRAGLIGSVLMNLSIVLKFFLMKGYVTVPLALTSGMQIFFVLDLFAREEKLLSTATYTSDTVGFAFILLVGFMVPIGFALQNVYIFLHEAKSNIVPHYCSAAIVLLFFVGYYIYLTSTNLKHNFRKNPFSSSLSEVVSIPTRHKKKRLISSGWWGRVRHPNYLGLFIMAVAWTLPCGISHAVPYGPLLLLAIALVLRSFRIESQCKEKYGPAWNNYIEKVRSRLLPFIF